MAEKKSFGAYLEEAQKENVVLMEGAKELHEKAAAYLEKKDKENESYEAFIKDLEELANKEFVDIHISEIINPQMVADEYPDLFDDATFKKAEKFFNTAIDNVGMLQALAAQMAAKMRSTKEVAKKDKPSK